MTAMEVFQLIQATEVTYESLTHLLSNLRPEEFDMIFDIARGTDGLPDIEVSFWDFFCMVHVSTSKHGGNLKPKQVSNFLLIEFTRTNLALIF